ncbi:hypothetical protein Zmor_016238 [Zophobas morio]|uniref:Uncharacterized protein n=1 Tax=Zophobas morio TaxID=2755281 RepID=A0AA38INP2_9CUCU|nr:hypothetical protein Zmor_016238 [Zophobas morio]
MSKWKCQTGGGCGHGADRYLGRGWEQVYCERYGFMAGIFPVSGNWRPRTRGRGRGWPRYGRGGRSKATGGMGVRGAVQRGGSEVLIVNDNSINSPFALSLISFSVESVILVYFIILCETVLVKQVCTDLMILIIKKLEVHLANLGDDVIEILVGMNRHIWLAIHQTDDNLKTRAKFQNN